MVLGRLPDRHGPAPGCTAVVVKYREHQGPDTTLHDWFPCFPIFQTIRQKILDFLNPLTALLGVQLMAAVAAVWSRKRGKRHSKAKVS